MTVKSSYMICKTVDLWTQSENPTGPLTQLTHFHNEINTEING